MDAFKDGGNAAVRADDGADSNVCNLHGRGDFGIFYSKSQDEPSAHARRVDLTDLRDPQLKGALAAWDELCGLDNAFDRGRQAAAALYRSSRLLTPRSTVLRVTDGNPLNWIFVYFGGGLGVFDGQSFVGRRMRDFPATPTTDVSAYSFTDAIMNRCPVAHEIEGVVECYFLKYQRIAFPILDDGGDLFEMLTISSEVFRVEFS